MVSKWARRFYDNIDPSPNERGFDHILSGTHDTRITGNEALNLDERMVELKDRISLHAGIHATPPLPYFYLAWNKNPQCPPDEWKKMSVPFVPTSKKTFKGLAVQRHSEVKSTLDNINHIELSFSINNDIDFGDGFWLIDDQYKDFVYAILKSSMFRAWCELTAYTDGKGQGHFTVGMWDTFPLPYLSPCNEKFIIGAAKDKNWNQLNILVDKLFVPGISNPLQDSLRLRILAEGFLNIFPSLKTDVKSLA